jgi:hypothetical protein
MRPIYETDADRNKEEVLAEKLEKAWSCHLHKLPIKYNLDYIVFKNKEPMALVEIKIRSKSMDEYDSMGGCMMDLHKWVAAKDYSTISEFPFIFVVQTSDGVWHTTVRDFNLHSGVIYTGRTDRGDKQDIEPHVTMKKDLFIRTRYSTGELVN